MNPARKEPEPVPSTSGMSETAAFPPSPIADDLSALPSPTSSPPMREEGDDVAFWYGEDRTRSPRSCSHRSPP